MSAGSFWAAMSSMILRAWPELYPGAAMPLMGAAGIEVIEGDDRGRGPEAHIGHGAERDHLSFELRT